MDGKNTCLHCMGHDMQYNRQDLQATSVTSIGIYHPNYPHDSCLTPMRTISLHATQRAADYMALPASQYSVLDGRKIERIDDDTFRCFVGEVRMFQWSAEPVLTLSVVVEPELGGCTIKLLSCEVRAGWAGTSPCSKWLLCSWKNLRLSRN